MDNEKTSKYIDMSKMKISKQVGDQSIVSAKIPPAGQQVEPKSLSATSQSKLPDRGLFPDQPRSGIIPPTTINNVKYVMGYSGITARYNVVKKKLEISVPGRLGTIENADDVAMTHITNQVARNGMTTGRVEQCVAAIGDEQAYNPVAEWINSKPWDGIDRLEDFYGTVVATDGLIEAYKKILLYRFLLSAVAAMLKPRGFRSRGVLTLQGPQGIGKTSWVRALICNPALRDEVIKTDHHMDPSDKDSRLGAITNWLVEIGELDSTFRKDIAALKGFLTSDADKLRRPYGKTASEYPRRTVFIATVNEPYFLVDTTGNSRWWTIPVSSLNYEHQIDMQQLYAQLAIDFHNGAQCWLTTGEEAFLDNHNSQYQAVSVIRDKVVAYIDPALRHEPGLATYTSTELLEELGIKSPTNTQARECGSILRELLGHPKRIQGRDKWRVPIRCPEPDPWFPNGQPDPYD